uniref:VWA domain-containing protein n=1 Tax=Schlesneria paludicola TaxID=360056 RepID=A0A7C4LMB6_9PLAN
MARCCNVRWTLPDRRCGWSVLCSGVGHALVLGILACWSVSVPGARTNLVIDATWTDPRPDIAWEPTTPTNPQQVSLDAGGAAPVLLTVAEWLESAEQQPSVTVPMETQVETQDAEPTVRKPGRHTVRPVSATNGAGQGPGIGPGQTEGFFGVKPPAAARIVFVVDSSRSMNHRHDSELKTRFRRVKFELLKCITEMQADQFYYVIFFSNETLPMPASGLQPARPGLREPYLQWIGQVPSGGSPTDPRQALRLALQLQPDFIFFLTDGEFPSGVSRQLRALRQDRVVIHTFAFGETLGEDTLKTLAANNRGEYRFVP